MDISPYQSAAFAEALRDLTDRLRDGADTVLLVGASGSGRTTVLETLAKRLALRDVAVCYCFPALSFEQILETVLASLDVSPVDGECASAALDRALGAWPADAPAPVLLIDDANDLSDTVLQRLYLLCEASPPRRRGIQIVLAGGPSLHTRFAEGRGSTWTPRMPPAVALGVLTRDEVAGYLAHRLFRRARSLDGVFTPEAIQVIEHEGGGLPGRLETICSAAIAHARRENRVLVDATDVEAAIGVLSEARAAAPTHAITPVSRTEPKPHAQPEAAIVLSQEAEIRSADVRPLDGQDTAPIAAPIIAPMIEPTLPMIDGGHVRSARLDGTARTATSTTRGSERIRRIALPVAATALVIFSGLGIIDRVATRGVGSAPGSSANFVSPTGAAASRTTTAVIDGAMGAALSPGLGETDQIANSPARFARDLLARGDELARQGDRDKARLLYEVAARLQSSAAIESRLRALDPGAAADRQTPKSPNLRAP